MVENVITLNLQWIKCLQPIYVQLKECIKILNKIKCNFKNDRSFTMFIMVGIFAGIAGGIYNTVFNNFLNATYHLTESQRGFLELPREFPGVCIAIVLGLLAFLGDTRLSAIGMFLASIGLVGMGYLSPTYVTLILFLMVYSLGTHMYMPLSSSIGMSLSDSKSLGRRLGLYSAYGLFATLFGYTFVWVGFKFCHLSYKGAFVSAAFFYLIASFFAHQIKTNNKKPSGTRFVFKKKYSLYYVLCLLYGARKQVFLTFAPWVLISIFHLDAPTFAILGVIVSVLSIGTRTIVGNAIDKLGERFVLCSEAILLIIICCGYAFSQKIFSASVAVIIMCACYILDNSLSVVEMARSTYVKKICDTPDDVTPTLSTGTSLDHIFAMTIPTLGGLLWKVTGTYQSVFIAAAIIAMINLVLSLNIRLPKHMQQI